MFKKLTYKLSNYTSDTLAVLGIKMFRLSGKFAHTKNEIYEENEPGLRINKLEKMFENMKNQNQTKDLITKSDEELNDIDDSNLTEGDKLRFVENAIEYNEETKKVAKSYYDDDTNKTPYVIRTVKSLIDDGSVFMKEVINFNNSKSKVKPSDLDKRNEIKQNKKMISNKNCK